MTFKEWIANPSGKGSSVMSTKGMYKEMYVKKLDTLLLREGNKFTYHLYKSMDEFKYYIHMLIPSEIIKNFYYDIVIEFSTTNPAYSVGPTLNDYDIKVFTNSPDFIFTHAHAYNKAKMFFTDMTTKVPPQCLKEVAKVKNPKDEIGYVKSLYFTYLIMSQRKLFEKSNYRTAPLYKKTDLLTRIMDASMKISLRQEAESELKAKARKERKLQDKQIEEKNAARSKSSTGIKTVGRTNSISGVSNIKRVGHSKKIK